MRRKGANDATPQPANATRVREWLCRLARTTLVIFLVSALDLLGVHSALEPLSLNIAERTNGAFASGGPGQKKITVVLIDDAYVDGVNGKGPGWPLPANDFLRNILDPIVAEGPELIFVDLALTDAPRRLSTGGEVRTVEATRALGEGLREAGKSVPILMGDTATIEPSPGERCGKTWIDAVNPADGLTTAPGILDAALAPGTPVGRPGVEWVVSKWVGTPTQYPIAVARVALAANCRLHAGDASSASADATKPLSEAGAALSPAAAILARLCTHPEQLAATKATELCSQLEPASPATRERPFALYSVAEALEPPILVQWKTLSARTLLSYRQNQQGAEQCVPQTTHWWLKETGVQAIRALFPSLSALGISSEAERRCFYFDTLTSDELNPAVSALPDALRSAALKDRIVMIGAGHNRKVPDWVSEPTGTEVPGVFLHAMALDNLLSDGPHYPIAAEAFSKYAIELPLEALLVALMVDLAARVVRKKRAFLPADREGRLGVAAYIIVLIVAVFAVFIFALLVPFALRSLMGFRYFGSPMFIAAATAVALLEGLEHPYLEGNDPVLAAQSKTHPGVSR